MSNELIGRVTAGEDLSMTEMANAVDHIMQGEWADEQIALLLTALYHKGESVEEIAGAAEAMRKHMTKIRSHHSELLDTCGTGGDGSRTFNVSTAAALVTAAAGVPVAKHGNRSITSKTGSADVLAELGVNIEATVTQAETCLDQVGICFCFAPLLHQSMKNVANVRRSLEFRTIFNLLGPLCNPADAGYQLLGVAQPELRPVMAAALNHLGTQRAVVVCGDDGLDEVTLRGSTSCSEVTPSTCRDFRWTPNEFGFTKTDDFRTLEVDGPSASAAKIRSVLAGDPGPAADIVALNAAAAIWTVKQIDPLECGRLAKQAIESGAANDVLQKLATASHA